MFVCCEMCKIGDIVEKVVREHVMGSRHGKSGFIPRILDVYIYINIRDKDVVVKVAQFDVKFWCWDIDRRGALWMCLEDRALTASKIVAEET